MIRILKGKSDCVFKKAIYDLPVENGGKSTKIKCAPVLYRQFFHVFTGILL